MAVTKHQRGCRRSHYRNHKKEVWKSGYSTHKEKRSIMEWLLNGSNLSIVLAVIMVLDKIVKATPTKYDDAIVDGIKAAIGAFTKKG
jgi:hypothetical protein